MTHVDRPASAGRPARPDGTFDLLIERSFAAPRSEVFRLWEDRDLLIQWWGPKDFTCTHVELEFRVGGAYRICIVSAKWGESWMGGVFREIVRDEKIVMTFAWEDGRDQPAVETLVTVTFADEAGPGGGRTVQRFHQAPFLQEDSRDSHIGGWSECFDGEEEFLRERAGGAG